MPWKPKKGDFAHLRPQVITTKINDKVTDGPSNLHQILIWNNSMPKKVLEIVKPTLERNAYLAHVKNVLLAMTTDEKSKRRELGWRRILKTSWQSEENAV